MKAPRILFAMLFILSAEGRSADAPFIRGDANADGRVDLADAVASLEHLFAGRPNACPDAVDVDDSGVLDVGDPIALLNHLFAGGAAPRPPYPEAGPDPTPDPLGCAAPVGLVALEPAEACPGETIALLGRGFHPLTWGNRVLFRSAADPGYAPEGEIAAASMERLDCIVPGSAPSGTVELYVVGPGGEERLAGALPFTSCPVLAGIVIGERDRYGAVEIVSPARLHPKAATLYGYNLEGAVAVRFEDEWGEEAIDAPSFAGVAPPEGIADPRVEAVRAEIPLDLLFLYLDLYEVRVRVLSPKHASNAVGFHVKKPWEAEGPTLAGVFVPGGSRAGVVPVLYQSYGGDPAVLWDLVAEYSADGGLSWRPATAAESEDPEERTRGLFPGTALSPSEVGALAGPGLAYRFLWDSEADLPGFAGSVALRLRLQAAMLADPLFSTRLECPPILIDNAAPARAGAVLETFDDDAFEDPGETTASWADPAGVGRGLAGREAPLFGEGVADLALDPIERTDGEGAYSPGYIFDTDRGAILVADRRGKPTEETIDGENPGAARGEFHFRSLRIAKDVVVRGRGSRPLVIRLRGSEVPEERVFLLEGMIDADGSDGGGGGTFDPGERPLAGIGGAGGPGGGKGGDGGAVALAPGRWILDVRLASSGEGAGGGGAGRTVTYASEEIGPAGQPTISDAFGGSGGGGSHATAGGEGQAGGSARDLPPRRSGGPGPIHGNDRIHPLAGGSGGGGGGGYIYRSTGSLVFLSGAGSGGGGGGGAVRIVANGSLSIRGVISADGGEGGDRRSRGGSGGGGSGGAILLQAAGWIELGDAASLHARGGRGGDSGSGSTSRRAIGGDGGEGRIRIEAGMGTVGPLPIDPESVHSGASCFTMGELAGPVGEGDGRDGPLDLFSPPDGVYEIDTDTGALRDPAGSLILEAASGGGEFRLERLLVSEGVVLRARGTQPLLLRVRGDAYINGTIDVSGEDAGGPVPGSDLPPPPGRGGPGGGAGGIGGYVAEDGSAVHGAPGELPALLPEALVDRSRTHGHGDPDVPIPPEMVRPALGGETPADGLGGGSGGGGAGYCRAGEDGAGPRAGSGGTAYGSAYFLSPIDGSYLPLGGAGGGGGGGAPDAPGAGGGGGGGFLGIFAGGVLELAGDAVLDASGGDARAGLTGSGGGGGGSGGGIHMRAARPLLVRGGARLTIDGGLGNLGATGDGEDARSGDGAPGRILIEVPQPVSGVAADIDPPPSIDVFRPGIAPGVLASRPYPIPRVGPRGADRTVDPPEIVLAGPPGPIEPAIVVEGAPAGSDALGAPGPFRPVAFGEPLPSGTEYLRFRLLLFSDLEAGVVPAVESVRIPYR